VCLQQILDLCAGSSDCYISYDWNNRLKYAFIFHFFGLLWTNQFIVGLSSVVVAGAVANYYWSRGDTKRCGFGMLMRTECPVQLSALFSLVVALRNHLRMQTTWHCQLP
jgi:hypothetical protein